LKRRTEGLATLEDTALKRGGEFTLMSSGVTPVSAAVATQEGRRHYAAHHQALVEAQTRASRARKQEWVDGSAGREMTDSGSEHDCLAPGTEA